MDEELRLFLYIKAPEGAGSIFSSLRQACQTLRKNTASPLGLNALLLSVLHRSIKTPAGLVIFFLRHRQACQKLRENTTSPHGFCVVYMVAHSEVSSRVYTTAYLEVQNQRQEGAGMAFGSVWQACLSSRKLSPPPPAGLVYRTIFSCLQGSLAIRLDML